MTSKLSLFTNKYPTGYIVGKKNCKNMYFLLGSEPTNKGYVWCMNKYGNHVHIHKDSLVILSADECHPIIDTLCKKYLEQTWKKYQFNNKVETSHGATAWWLGWFYEDKHHELSVWLYVLAQRINPNEKIIHKLLLRLRNPKLKEERNIQTEYFKSIPEFNSHNVDTGSIQEAFKKVFSLFNDIESNQLRKHI